MRPRSAHSTRVKGDNKYTLLENINLIQILLLLFKTLCISRQFYLQLIREFPSTNSPEDNYNLDKICLKKKKLHEDVGERGKSGRFWRGVDTGGREGTW